MLIKEHWGINNGIMCILCTPRRIYRSTYRPILDRCIGQHIGRVSVDMLVDISVDTRPICRPRYVGRFIDRLGWVMVDISTDYRQISRSMYRLLLGRYVDHWLLAEYRPTVGGISPGQKLRLSVTDVYKTVASTPKKYWNKNFFFWNIGQKTWNLLKLLCCPLLVWNFSQPIACLKLFCVKFEDVPIISHFESMRSKQLNSGEMRFGTLNRVQN